MLEFSVIIAFIAVICWGFGDFFIQRATRRIGDVESLFFIGLIGSIVLLPFAWNQIFLLSISDALFLALIGAITFVVAIVLFEALKKGKLAAIDVLFEIELPVTVILALFFFKEQLSFLQGFLILVIFLGIILIALEKLKFAKQLSLLEKGALLAIFGSIGMGLLNFFTAAAAKNISPIMAIFVPWVVYMALCLIVIIKRKGISRLVQHAKQNKAVILGEGLFDTFAWVLFAFALAAESASIITAITESYPAIALLLGVLINKERIRKHQYLGAGIALVACIILATTV